MPTISETRKSVEHRLVVDCLKDWRNAMEERVEHQEVTNWTPEEHLLLSKIRREQAAPQWKMGLATFVGVLGVLRVAPVLATRMVQLSSTWSRRRRLPPTNSFNSPFAKTQQSSQKPFWFQLNFQENQPRILYFWGWVLVDLSIAGFAASVVAEYQSAAKGLTTSACGIFPPQVVLLNGPYTDFHCPLVEKSLSLAAGQGEEDVENALANPETKALRSVVEFYQNCRKRGSSDGFDHHIS